MPSWMVAPPLPWAACSNAWRPFRWRNDSVALRVKRASCVPYFHLRWRHGKRERRRENLLLLLEGALFPPVPGRGRSKHTLMKTIFLIYGSFLYWLLDVKQYQSGFFSPHITKKKEKKKKKKELNWLSLQSFKHSHIHYQKKDTPPPKKKPKPKKP